ncbi:MAG TPA: methyl-accepting chemotaxis protein [Rhodocyclaceae bacterium]|nr:methyl-accepting chemotaxis protein [Rhodocyclaceae bacterium]
MNLIFAPAIGLMNRLRFTHKFLLIGGVGGVLVVLLFVQLFNTLTGIVEASRKELEGITLSRDYFALVADTQRHRALSSAVLNGNSAMQEQRTARAEAIARHRASVEAALLAELKDRTEWADIRERLDTLAAGQSGAVASESFFFHTMLIEKLLLFSSRIADGYGMTLDPDIDSYYLMISATDRLPGGLELLGQIRGLGVGIVTRKTITDEEKMALVGLLAELDRTSRVVETNLAKTAEYNPDMAEALGDAAIQLLIEVNNVKQLLMREVIGERFELSAADYYAQLSSSIDRGYAIMFDALFPALERVVEARVTRLAQARALVVAVSCVAAAIVLYLSIGTYLATIGSLRKLADVATVLATGDLRPRIELGTRDELSVVATSFNRMADAFVHLMQSVRHGADQVLDAAQRMAASSEHITRGSAAQSDSAAGMAAAIEEMTVSVDQISSNGQQADAIARKAGKLSEQGATMVDTVVAEISKIASSVNHSADLVDALGKRSDEITSIVNVIREIADQTNLLALNAAIEAARAGESGRGFAVVADEVRKLAERTGKSTEEIATMVAAIQAGTRRAVESMREGVERVNDGVALAERAGSAMGDIRQCTTEAVAAIADISGALREQSAASTEIAKNVETIAQMAEENSTEVGDNARTATQLNELARQLDAEIGQFRFA